MVLLGGDLFHDNKPSRATLFRTMGILKKYVFGDNPVRFKVQRSCKHIYDSYAGGERPSGQLSAHGEGQLRRPKLQCATPYLQV